MKSHFAHKRTCCGSLDLGVFRPIIPAYLAGRNALYSPESIESRFGFDYRPKNGIKRIVRRHYRIVGGAYRRMTALVCSRLTAHHRLPAWRGSIQVCRLLFTGQKLAKPGWRAYSIGHLENLIFRKITFCKSVGYRGRAQKPSATPRPCRVLRWENSTNN